MTDRDPLFLSFSHLNEFPREKEALHTLKRLASLVKPIMRARGWRVNELAEFYPPQRELLGLNINSGQRILVRLRHPGDRNQFLPFEQVTDTLLHELSHIVWGPHDEKFHALWNQLRDEHEGLVRKGYTGEGFLSQGRRVGGRGPIPIQEARRLARVEAEKRRRAQETARSSSGTPGHILGGSAPQPGQDIRAVIASAADRRNTSLKGCGNTKHSNQEIRSIAETATRNGFRTQAEEDAANDAAIAQALWELVQEDERDKHGSAYIPPSAAQPEGNGGGTFLPIEYYAEPSSGSGSSSGTGTATATATGGGSSSSRTVAPAPQGQTTTTSGTTSSRRPADGWNCDICTLYNPALFLCCDACGTERSENVSR